MAIDHSGNIFYLNKNLKSIIKINQKGEQVSEIQLPDIGGFSFIRTGIDNSIIIFYKRKIYVLENGATTFKPHPANSQLSAYKKFPIFDFIQSPDGQIWISGEDRQLLVYHETSGKWHSFHEDLVKLIPNRLTLGKMFMDNTGVLWVRTIMGLIKVNTQRTWFDTYFTLPADACNGYCSFRGFTEDHAGNIYASFYGNIFKIDPTGITDYTTVLPFPNTPFDLFYENENLLLNDGRVYNLNTNQVGNIYQSNNINFVDLGIYTSDENNEPWWGYRSKIYRINRENINPFWEEMLDLGRGNKKLITDIKFDKSTRNIWIASPDNLQTYHIESGKVETIDNSLLGKFDAIRYLYPDNDSSIWLGTEKGLIHYNYSDGISKKYLKEDGLPDNYIVSILPEGDSCLWLATNYGLSRFDKNSENFINFYEEDGLANNEFNRRSAFKARDGKLFFGGIRGVTAFYPSEIMKKYSVPILSEKLSLIAFSKTDINRDTTITTYFQGETPLFNIYHQNKTFNIEFALTDYRQTDKIQYSYQLQGYDGIWSKPSPDNSVKFNSLPSGSYNLKIRALNGKGQWHSNELNLKINVHPPWWESWWAYSVYFLVISGICFGIYFFLKKRLQLRNELLLEQQEANRLKELDTFKSRLYTNLTHEFRTPLTVILGMTQQILESPKNGVENAAKLIENNGRNLLRLVNQLLDLSKLEDNSFKLQLQQSDVVPYLRYVTESFQTYANSQNLSLRFFSTLKTLEMEFDPEQLKQVMTNLISNAIKFTESGGEVKVELEYSKPNHLQIAVSDTGVGIPASELPHIFDRFYQVDGSATRVGEGTGIGLSHSMELVKLMGGNIAVESELRTGTTFNILIPIKLTKKEGTKQPLIRQTEIEAPLLSMNHLAAKDAQILSTVDESASRVLIIEDNADVVVYLKSCLANQYNLDVAFNGKIGIEKAMETIPDLIISDVMMPEKDGYEVCDILKNDERTSHIPIILLTAKADVASKITGLRKGADAYIAKPFDKEELLVRLEKLAELRMRLKERFSGLTIDNFSKVVNNEDSTTSLDLEDAFVQKILKIVETNYTDDDFALAQLCQKAGMSRSQIFRKMKALLDISPSDFIRNYRLDKAKMLLEKEEFNVSEAAYQTGFKDPSYFSKLYQERFGMTPSESRNN